MAAIITRPQTTAYHPTWAKDYLSREHLMPGGAKIDPAQFVADNGVSVTTTGPSAAAEVQTVTLNNTPTGGTFTLSYDGQVTAPIAYNATGANVQTALRALTNVGATGVTVAGAAGGPFTVTFAGTLVNMNVPQIIGNGTALTGAGAQPTVTVATTTQGQAAETAAGSTTLACTATSGIIPAGTMLMFGGGQIAYVNTQAAAGATSLSVEPLAFGIPNGAVAYYRGTGWVTIRDGTVIGRTFAERDAGTPYGPVADTDDEMYLLAYTIDDARTNNDADLYRWGSLVDETHLPGFAGLSTAVKTYLRSHYQCTVGAE